MGTVASQSVAESKVNNNSKIMIRWCFSFLNLYFLFSFPNQTVNEALPMSLRWTELSVSTYLLLTSEINCSISQSIYSHVAEWQNEVLLSRAFCLEQHSSVCAHMCVLTLTHTYTHTFFSLYNYFDSAINKSCPKGPCRVSDMPEEWFSSHKFCCD